MREATFSLVNWHPHPDVWILMAVLAGGYLWAITRWGPRTVAPDTPVVTRFQAGSYLLGVAALWVGADWPVHELSEDFLLSVHMVQHMLFSLVAPPLLLLGMPRWMLRKILAPARLKQAIRFVTRPLVALILFNGVIVVTHWPLVVDLALRVEVIHLLVHVVLVGASLAMWWPVVAPLPEMPSLTDPGKMFYLFLQSIIPTVPASFLTFADGIIYSFYGSVPRLWGISALTDQRVAGLIMKLAGGLLLWIVITVVFFRWNAREEKPQPEDLSWDEFERELEAWNLRR